MKLGVGISAESQDCLRASSCRDIHVESGDATEERVEQHLAFGRVNGTYCVHAKTVAFHQGDFGILQERVYSEQTPWSP